MWNYEKRLQYPVKITQTNPKMAQVIISQFGGPDGELAASMRYLSQRYTMPYKEVTGILTDIGTEELAHMEMICAIVYQLTKDLSPEEIKASGFDKYYVDHTLALWPQAASGTPWTATYFQSKGDPITDLHEDQSRRWVRSCRPARTGRRSWSWCRRPVRPPRCPALNRHAWRRRCPRG